MSEIYDTEVEVLLKIGGQKALENQYKNISRRLDKMSDENKSLKQRIAELESFSVQAEQDSTSLVFDLQKKIKSLQELNDKLYNQLMENEKDYQEELEKMNRLVSDLYNQAQKETKKDFEPSSEWYENRHQSDCIEINRLNTTIDVLIHKVEYLRQFAGLE